MAHATGAVAPRQERQLVAYRYRLASLHRQDQHTEVWRAVDEETQKVVTIEFLRSTTPDLREKFLAQARRLQAQAQPTAIRVAAIHEDPYAPFVVFEHLVSVSVPQQVVNAPRPAPQAPPPPAPPPPAPTPAAPAFVMPTPVRPTPPAYTPTEPSAPIEQPTEPVASAIEEVVDHDHGLGALSAAWRARDLALVDSTILKESALEAWAMARARVQEFRLEDIHFDTVVATARVVGAQALALLLAAIVWAGGRARGLLKVAPRVSAPRISATRVATPQLPKPVAAP